MLNSKKMAACMTLASIMGTISVPTYAFAMTQQQAMEYARYRNAQLELENQIKARYNAGLNAYMAGNYNGCLQYLTPSAVAAKYQNNRDYNVAIGDSYFRLQNYSKAIAYLSRSYNIGGSSLSLVNIDLGMSYYNMGNFSQSAGYLRQAMNSSLADGDILWALAVSGDKIGNKQVMLSAMETIISRYPNYNVQCYITVGMAYMENQKYGVALNVFKKGLGYFQDNADLLYWIGHIYYLDGNYEGAIPYLEKSNALLPNNIDTLYDLGASYLVFDRLDEAATCADIMMKLDENNPKSQDLYKAVQQKIMQKQMEQQMQMDMINQQIQDMQDMANMSMNQTMPAGMM